MNRRRCGRFQIRTIRTERGKKPTETKSMLCNDTHGCVECPKNVLHKIQPRKKSVARIFHKLLNHIGFFLLVHYQLGALWRVLTYRLGKCHLNAYTWSSFTASLDVFIYMHIFLFEKELKKKRVTERSHCCVRSFFFALVVPIWILKKKHIWNNLVKTIKMTIQCGDRFKHIKKKYRTVCCMCLARNVIGNTCCISRT